MATYKPRYISNIDEFAAIADQWNDLWARSYPTHTIVRCEGILNWANTFKRETDFSAIVIESESSLVLAMPLCKTRIRGLLPTTGLPGNSWSECGNLLMDQPADASCMDVLLHELREHTSGLLALEDVPVESPQWRVFFGAVDRMNGVRKTRWRRDIAVVDILGDWQKYRDSWTSKFRSSVKRSIKKLEKEFEVRVERFRNLNAEELEKKLRVAFEVEDRSWKGKEGSSVLKSPGMLHHFEREALEAERCGFLDLWFLWAGDHAIAFEYCHIANSVCYSCKMGYDQNFAKFGPGRILRYYQLKGLHEDGSCRLFDMLGLVDDSKARWSTRFYPIENLFVTLNPLANVFLKGLARVKSFGMPAPADAPKFVPGAKLDLDTDSHEANCVE